ncbi:sensor histidine kinase [Variovorax sp. M-6]
MALMASILLFWCGWGVFMSWWMWRDQSGFVDTMLKETAELVLFSLPENVGLLSAVPPAAPAVAAPASYRKSGEVFQVWVNGRNVIRSPDAPLAPIRASFTDGYSREQVNGAYSRVYAVSDAGHRIQVQVSRPLAQWRQDVWTGVSFSLLNTLAMLVPLSATIWFVIRWSFRPVTAVRVAVQEKEALDFSPLPIRGLPEEMRSLVESFNRLLERLHRAVEGERRFIADAAHELRTPLAALSAQAFVAQRAEGIEEKNAALALLATGVDRTARLSEQLLELARLDAAADTARHVPLELSRLVEIVVRDFQGLARHRNQQLSLDIEPCMIWGDVDELGILLRNLVDNALRFSGEGGQIAISCRLERIAGARGVCLRVTDDGPGVPPPLRDRIFERFYRVAGSGQPGSGIGLSLVWRIAQLHEARIEVGEGLHGRGLSICVRFPEWLDPAAALVQG